MEEEYNQPQTCNGISDQFHYTNTNMNDVSSQLQSQINLPSTIIPQQNSIIEVDGHQLTITQNHTRTSFTSSSIINPEDVEVDIRKRLRREEGFSIWNTFTLFEITREGEEKHEKEWKLTDIFTNPQPGAMRLFFRKEFNDALENDHKQWVFQCNTCEERFPFYASSRYSQNAYDHYKKCHLQEEIDKDAPGAKRTYGKVTTGDDYTNKANALVAATLITAKLPYQFVENEQFISLVDHLQGDKERKYIVPCKKSFSETIIPQMTERVLKTIKEDISDVKGVMATLDGWTTKIENDPYLSFTLHYVKNNEMKRRVLKLSDLCQSHKSEDIVLFITKTIEEFGLQQYCPMVIMTDNAPNVMKAVRDSGNIAVGCACHRIQNAIKKTLNECPLFKFLVDKCNRISNSFKRNGEWNELLKEVEKEIYEKILKPKSNVNTRWFSNIEVMKRMIEIKNPAAGVVKALSLQLDENLRNNFIKDNTFDDKEIEMIEFMLDKLNKLHEMSNKMSSETFPSLSLLIPEYFTILREIDDEINNFGDIDDDYDQVFTISTYKISTKDREFSDYSLFEDTLMKIKEIKKYEEHLESFQTKRNKLEFLQSLKQSMIEKFEGENSIMENEVVLYSTILNPNNKFDYFDDDEMFEKVKQVIEKKVGEMKQVQQIQNAIAGRKIRSKPTAEVDAYIDEDCLSDATLEEIMTYWKLKKDRLKVMYQMSEKYLYLLASSTSSERLFSHASGFYSNKRTLLAPSHLEESCIVHSWLITEGFELFENMKFESK